MLWPTEMEVQLGLNQYYNQTPCNCHHHMSPNTSPGGPGSISSLTYLFFNISLLYVCDS